MKKNEKSKFHRNLIISLCFLSFGVGFGFYIGNLFLGNNPPIVKKYPKPFIPPAVTEIKKELYAMEKMNQLLSQIENPINFDKTWEKYKGIVYNAPTKIDIKDEFVASATLGTNDITVPSNDIPIAVGEHTLILTLKDKSLASNFGGNPTTGEVTYKIWVKDKIDKKKIIYSTNVDDTELLTGLISTSGNTNGAEIIQTRNKQGQGIGNHESTLTFTIDDTLIDYDNSFYVKGTVDNQNNFTETEPQIRLNPTTKIENDGIYHLHLEDKVGNVYDSYLELGQPNWILNGQFNDKNLTDLAQKLNVTLNLTASTQENKQEALVWLQNYEQEIIKKFKDSVLKNGKGFDISIKNDFNDSYLQFLNPVTYVNNQANYAINQSQLDTSISQSAQQKLKDGLDSLNNLPNDLNVDTRNVVDKKTLGKFIKWINRYKEYVDKNKVKWLNDAVDKATREFATVEQIEKIKKEFDIKKYLKRKIWTE